MSPSPTLSSMYIDEFKNYLDEINEDSPCILDTMVAILLYANNVVLLPGRVALQKIANHVS